MKKFVMFFLIGALISTTALSQSSDEKVLKGTIKDKKADRKEMGKDVTHLRAKAAVRHRREVKRHRKSIHRQGENLQNQGVKHPVRKAKHQAKADKDAKNGRD